MAITTATAHVALLSLSAAITAALALYAWRNRAEPGAVAFGGLMLAVTVWTVGYASGLLGLPGGRLFWENVSWFGIVFVPVFFFLFALSYTGYDGFVSRTAVGLLSIEPVVTIALVWSNPVHGLVWAENRVVVVDGVAFAVQTFGPWFWVNLLYAYSLIGVGSFLLLRLVVRSDYLFFDQSALLLVGVVVPVVGNVVSIFGSTPYPGIDLAPYAFTGTGLAFGYATFRHRLFELVPATRQLGRNAAISDLEDGVLIVDNGRQLVYLNDAAARIFDRTPDDVLGRPVGAALPTDLPPFDTADARAEFELSGRTYETRSSPIYDQHERQLGATLVVQDVTERKRRERMLERQRDELATLAGINDVIREINRALVGATTREEIETALCERLVASDLYQAAWAGRGLLSEGSIEWTAAVDERDGSGAPGAPTAEAPSAHPVGEPESAVRDVAPAREADLVLESDRGVWTTVPLAYDGTIYGVLVVFTERTDAFTERERQILDELGETIGLAVNAVENRKLLLADAVVEVELVCTDGASVFVDASASESCVITLQGIVPAAENRLVAYALVEDAPPERVREAMAATPAVSRARVLSERRNGGFLEVTLSGGSVLVSLATYGAHITSARVAAGECRVVAEVAPDTDVRHLVRSLQREFPDTALRSKRELDRPIGNADGLPAETVGDLTERQRQALEAAYLAGYFEWPRESTAEEVAESMGVSAPTFYSHLRKAQNRLLAEVVDGDDRREPRS